MEKKKSFAELENLCEFRFPEIGKCFHICSQENSPVLFHSDEEFKAAINIVAFEAFLFKDVRILTFEVMDNHFHFVMSGEENRIRMFLRALVLKLGSTTQLSAQNRLLDELSFKILPIDSLNNLRNVIAYVNRNGAVVNPDESVFTYKWGANRFFFNLEARMRLEACGETPTSRHRREMFHSDLLAKEDKLIELDGYISPLCFCHISEAEKMFRNSRHYFYCISRNIEASKEIAKSIGESIFYTDDDLYAHISALCSKKYCVPSVALLPKDAKLDIARELHFDFNAGNKQISRLLKMELSVVSAMFPE